MLLLALMTTGSCLKSKLIVVDKKLTFVQMSLNPDPDLAVNSRKCHKKLKVLF